MKLTPEQLATFEEQGYIFLPEAFTPEEVEVLRREAEQIYRLTDRKSGARRAARRAPPSPRTPTTRLSASSAPIPA